MQNALIALGLGLLLFLTCVDGSRGVGVRYFEAGAGVELPCS